MLTTSTPSGPDSVRRTLPDPILRQLSMQIDKRDLIVSNGDYIIYHVDGRGPGGFETGPIISEVVRVYDCAFLPFNGRARTAALHRLRRVRGRDREARIAFCRRSCS